MRCLKFAVLISTICSLITGCTGTKQISQFSSTTPSNPSDPTQAPPKVVNNLGFYIKNDTTKYTHYMTKASTFNTSCMIPTSTTTSQDVICRLDAMELDLNFYGLNLNFNVPPTMCAYLKVIPYYYYNWETGIGPSAVSLDIESNNGVTKVTACNVTTDNGANTDCANQPELTINMSSGELSCVYNHTAADGPNCCMGTYTLTKNITTKSTGSPDVNTVDTSTQSWGGNYTECFGGQGKAAWTKYTKSGFPASLVYNTKDIGTNDTMTIDGPMSGFRNDNFQIANYYTSAWHTHGAFKTGSVATSNYPYPIDPIDDRDGTSMYSTNDAYRIECLDEAHEVKHRIRLYVQEWNTYAQFLTLFTSSGASGNPNVVGAEGVDCDYSTLFGSIPCNDHRDFDDLVGIGTTTPAYDNSVLSNRAKWFPSEYY